MRFLLILLVSTLIFSSCSKKDSVVIVNRNLQDKEELVDPVLDSQQCVGFGTQTLWYLLDEKGKKINLSKDDSNIREIIDIITQHSLIVDNRTYETINAKNECIFYTDDFIVSLENNKYNSVLSKMYKDNNLVTEQGILSWFESYFNNDRTRCKVQIISEFQIVECAENYLEKNQLKLNIVYQQQRILYFQKANGFWKISNIDKNILIEKKSI